MALRKWGCSSGTWRILFHWVAPSTWHLHVLNPCRMTSNIGGLRELGSRTCNWVHSDAFLRGGTMLVSPSHFSFHVAVAEFWKTWCFLEGLRVLGLLLPFLEYFFAAVTKQVWYIFEFRLDFCDQSCGAASSGGTFVHNHVWGVLDSSKLIRLACIVTLKATEIDCVDVVQCALIWNIVCMTDLECNFRAHMMQLLEANLFGGALQELWRTKFRAVLNIERPCGTGWSRGHGYRRLWGGGHSSYVCSSSPSQWWSISD